MMKLNECISKVCCFYASDWHLTIMLLPFINKNIKENKIYMEFENSMEDKFKILLNKLDLKNKDKIEHISWNSTLQEDEYSDKEKIFIVSGGEEYIDEKNVDIENFYKKNNKKIKIINCYQVTNENKLNDIISKNKYKNMLNTRGEFLIK